MEGKKKYAWFGKWVGDYSKEDAAYKLGIDPEDYGKCEHAIRVEGSSYEIGVMKRKDGNGYSLVWDFFATGRNINKVIGDGAEKLMTEYSREFINQFANTNSFMLDESVDSEGNIVMNMMH